MKKRTIAIGALLLAINSFGQTNVQRYSICGKNKHEFDDSKNLMEIRKSTTPKNYQDFKFKLKKDEYFVLDLFDDIGRDILYLLYRDVTVYYRDGEVEKLYFSSDDNTIYFDGSFIKKIIVHKPELK